jgi:hypothetical protein
VLREGRPSRGVDLRAEGLVALCPVEEDLRPRGPGGE